MGIENHSIEKCPYCQKEIVIVSLKPSVLTLEAFQKEAKAVLKEVI